MRAGHGLAGPFGLVAEAPGPPVEPGGGGQLGDQRVTLGPGPLGAARHESLRDYRIAVWFDDPGAVPAEVAVRDRLDAVVSVLGAAGATVASLTDPPIGLEHERLAQRLLLQGEICGFMPVDSYAELLAVAANAGTDESSEHLRWARDVTARKRDRNAADAARQRLRALWAELVSRFDAVLIPVAAVAAFPHDHRPVPQRSLVVDGEHHPYWALQRWLLPANVAYLPATVAPAGLSPDGLPVRIQVLGPYLEDRTTIDLAARIGELCGGYRPPPGYR